MANRSQHRRQTRAGISWAWWLFICLLAGTAGWFWLIGHDLHIERSKEPASPTTAKASR